MDTIAEEFIPPILCQPNPLQVLEGEPEHEEVLRVSVFNNVFTLVPINILARRGICPLIAKLCHPTSGG
jgi:hypothetical protein